MTQHKKLSARLGALEAPRSSARVTADAEAEAEAAEGGGAAADAAAGAAAAAAAAADLAAAESREHFEELRSCIEALTMQVSESKQRLGKLQARIDTCEENAAQVRVRVRVRVSVRVRVLTYSQPSPSPSPSP